MILLIPLEMFKNDFHQTFSDCQVSDFLDII